MASRTLFQQVHMFYGPPAGLILHNILEVISSFLRMLYFTLLVPIGSSMAHGVQVSFQSKKLLSLYERHFLQISTIWCRQEVCT